MKRFLLFFLAAVLLLPSFAAGAEDGGGETYIVKYREAPDGAAVHTVSARELAALLREDALVWYAPDGDARLLGEASPYYADTQWNLAMIGADAAFRENFLGQGVRVGVLDSGVNPHPDFGERLLAGRNYIEGAEDDAATSDRYGHGTSVAGLIAAANDDGYIGVAPGAEIVPLKITDGEYVKISAICRAIYGGVDDFGCDVLNLSLGVAEPNAALEEAILYAEEHGVLVVSAVGNGGTRTAYYPAAYESVIGVGSLTKSGGVYDRSNHNDSVFLTAPGTELRSTAWQTDYANVTGTSYSVPQVSGAAAVLLGIDPTLTPAALRDLLARSAEDRGVEGYDEYYGHGMLNIANGIGLLQENENEDPLPPETEPTEPNPEEPDPEEPNPEEPDPEEPNQEEPSDVWVSVSLCQRDEACPLAAFTDLDPGAWYHDGIHFALESGMMNGVGADRFDPDGTMGRAMLLTVLWRMEGAPPQELTADFSDVPQDAWYADAVHWAYRCGVASGDPSGRFFPDDPLSRQELATLLFRHAAWKGAQPFGQTPLAGFPDADSVAVYARPPMAWAVSAGILRGVQAREQTFLDPDGLATRAQTATILTRLIPLLSNE